MFFPLHSVFAALVLLLGAASAAPVADGTGKQLARRAGRTSPPSGCAVVRKTPSSKEFATFQAAVDSLSTTATGKQCIFIYQGTYKEQVYIPSRKAQLTVYGYTTDTSSYSANTVTITQGRSQDDVANNDLTATLRAHAAGLQVYNINLENTRGAGRQALAVSAQADQQGYYGVKFIGYQDTILANQGNQVYARCYIDGAVDFIFGQRARAYFYKADIRIKGSGYITANGRDSDSNVSYYVIANSDIRAASGVSVAAGKMYLGRPWRNYSRVVFQNTYMSDVINGAGWAKWSSSTPNTDHVYYGEYKNTGPGASGTRASFATQLSAPITAAALLGSGYTNWADTSYLS